MMCKLACDNVVWIKHGGEWLTLPAPWGGDTPRGAGTPYTVDYDCTGLLPQ